MYKIAKFNHLSMRVVVVCLIHWTKFSYRGCCIKLHSNLNKGWYRFLLSANISCSLRTLEISLKSLSKDGLMWASQLALHSLVSASNWWQTLCTMSMDSAANLTLALLILAHVCFIVVLSCRFKCSRCRSIGILCPMRPLVLIHRHHFTSAASLGGK